MYVTHSLILIRYLLKYLFFSVRPALTNLVSHSDPDLSFPIYLSCFISSNSSYHHITYYIAYLCIYFLHIPVHEDESSIGLDILFVCFVYFLIFVSSVTGT